MAAAPKPGCEEGVGLSLAQHRRLYGELYKYKRVGENDDKLIEIKDEMDLLSKDKDAKVMSDCKGEIHPIGINSGLNGCFANALVQALYQFPFLRNLLKLEKDNFMNSDALNLLIQIFFDIDNRVKTRPGEEKITYSSEMIEKFAKLSPGRSVLGESDPHDLMIKIINEYTSNYRYFLFRSENDADLSLWVSKSQIDDFSKGGKVNYRVVDRNTPGNIELYLGDPPQTYNVLPVNNILHLDNSPTMTDMIDIYAKYKFIDSLEFYLTTPQNLQPSVVYSKNDRFLQWMSDYQQFPKILIVFVGRALPEGKDNTKIRSSLEITVTIDEIPVQYVLRTAIVHHGEGGANSGHFTAYAVDSGTAYSFNDSSYDMIDYTRVETILQDGYIYFYERADNPDRIAFYRDYTTTLHGGSLSASGNISNKSKSEQKYRKYKKRYLASKYQ